MAKFTHDCSECKCLGAYRHNGTMFDLYVCDNDNKSLIARFGDRGDEYSSFPNDIMASSMGKQVGGGNCTKYTCEAWSKPSLRK